MKRKNLVYILLILGALGVVGVCIAWYQYHKEISSSESATADFSVKDADFVKEFKAGGVNANNKYRDKVVEVSGKISSVEGDGKEPSLFMETGDATIQCIMAPDGAKAVIGVANGTSVKVKGIYTSFDAEGMMGMTIQLKDCHIEK